MSTDATTTDRTALGRIGIWSSALRTGNGDPAHDEAVGAAAAELEALGYGALWIGGSPAVTQATPLLAATSTIRVATGILSIWDHEAADVAADRAVVEQAYPGRFVLGIGVSHSRLAERYARPYSAMKEYLTGLDSAPAPVPASARVLAALGPKMLELSRDRAGGAHPYLVTPEHTAKARAILGTDALLAPEFKVVLDPDISSARATAREYLSGYLTMPNYTNNFTRLGFDDADYRDGGSDRLLDAMFALGDADTVASRAAEFLEAGADHLAIQVVSDDPRTDLPLAAWRELASTLGLAKS
ncbi:F420-dependent oxidoreductase [Streptomyces sp. AcH 505]|uniref:LLM class F420-dependent oxidoreductase n=1 Tax=Streptomyces sp. AcH 505 TaxID=352211 RepID=UPI000591BA25|nr:F420-dependent oxidoreductase [Streptomyces sp. AcH 505]